MEHEARVRAFGDGDLIAAATLQRGLQLFETSFGAFAYREIGGTWVTLGGPLCAPQDRSEMLDRLLVKCPRPVLCYLRESTLASLDAPAGAPGHLRARGLFVGGMGRDHEVDVTELVTRPPREVASASKKAARAGIRLEPFDLATLDREGRDRLREINEAYLGRARVETEMTFLNWPLDFASPHTRRAHWLVQDDPQGRRVFGFTLENPVYREGRRTGYLLDALRFEKTRTWGLWLVVVSALAKLCHAEGSTLTVGFCPLHGVEQARFGASRLLDFQLKLIARSLADVHFVRRLRELKSVVPHRAEPRFFCAPTRSAPRALGLFLEAMGAGPRMLFGAEALRAAKLAMKEALS
jgi:lysylphosphatidylglycerol synthetase-like protein (DUF2156 family)